jgi:alkylation response protein AidB-like acyl-CoA dehydrogenase
VTDVFLTQEERAFQEEVRDFVAREIAPRAGEIDRQDQVPAEVFKALNAYTTITYPPEHGGKGKGETYASIVVEEVGAACPALVPYLEVAQLFGIAVLLAGRDDQKQRYLTRLAAGEVGAYALADEGAGSDAANIATTATRVGDGYRLNRWAGSAQPATALTGSSGRLTYLTSPQFQMNSAIPGPACPLPGHA